MIVSGNVLRLDSGNTLSTNKSETYTHLYTYTLILVSCLYLYILSDLMYNEII